MTQKYHIAMQDSGFEVNRADGELVGVYKTERQARRTIESYKEDDSILETASNLIATAVKELMRTRKLDRRTAQNWIKEAAESRHARKHRPVLFRLSPIYGRCGYVLMSVSIQFSRCKYIVVSQS